MGDMIKESDSINIMMEEHKNILRMCKVIRSMCFGILKGDEIDYDSFERILDFIKYYADEHHHGKEEKYLFAKMQEYLGRIGENLITHGMLVEHDLGRMYMSNLREALERVKAGDEESKLDVIANIISYTHMISKHIAKEDEVVYTYGAKHLPQNVTDEIDVLSKQFEEEAITKGTQQKYIQILEELEKKVERNPSTLEI